LLRGDQRVLKDSHVLEGLWYLVRATDADATARGRCDSVQVATVK
jgi:hypothetical protein